MERSLQQALARSPTACTDLLAARYSLTDVALSFPYKVLTRPSQCSESDWDIVQWRESDWDIVHWLKTHTVC
jgi:hypothetical protein